MNNFCFETKEQLAPPRPTAMSKLAFLLQANESMIVIQTCDDAHTEKSI